ncbi:TBC1 domain family member 14 isoform X2 [Erpetoichthys calabaricus]|uniref:TBC1 domain family member 14 isoform X2 n=1 Tax=Erpetoichthys calabaricus TaxID=27687 RepID=UPI00109FCABF|nr:TBC1 domain family member 14 isoform X2 [Erpetoichthys calabaricus]XP_051784178.1 TBC1 domain family member 14 isoform X2 [Erpetoichthys calabaricus]
MSKSPACLMDINFSTDQKSSVAMGIPDIVCINSVMQDLENCHLNAPCSHSVPIYKPDLHFMGHNNEDTNSLASQDSGIPTLEISNPEPINCFGMNTKHYQTSNMFCCDPVLTSSSDMPSSYQARAVLNLNSENSLRKSSTFPRSGFDTLKLCSPSSHALNRSDDISVCSVSSLSTELSTTLSISNEDILDFMVTSDSSAIVNLETDEAHFSDVTLTSQPDVCEQTLQWPRSGTQVGNRSGKLGHFASFFTRSLFVKKVKDAKLADQKGPGWKLFGKVPLRDGLLKNPKEVQKEYEDKSEQSYNSPSPQQTVRRNLDFEPLSTTALILEDRPSNLPAKPAEEAQKHRQQYEEMVAQAKKRELKDAQKRRKQLEERCKLEESIGNAALTWNQEILPNWEAMCHSRKVRELWWQGIPPCVRGKVWSLAIGNDLNITHELYDICLARAKEKWKSLPVASPEAESEEPVVPLADKEGSLELIKLDISRTFPNLCIFQKGGPYHDMLHSILGAYTCYRPDVGYVQGMSFIAAVLILNLDTADAFIAFTNLLNKPCQMAFFRVDHSLMLTYFAAFEVFFEENLPKLFAHFKKSNLTPDIYLIDWIFTLYSKSLPLDLACRVWDVFCRDGDEFLFRTALGILKLYEDILTKMDFIHIAQFLTKLPEDIPTEELFAAIAAIQMQSRNKKWTQVLSALQRDNKEQERCSPILKR